VFKETPQLADIRTNKLRSAECRCTLDTPLFFSTRTKT